MTFLGEIMLLSGLMGLYLFGNLSLRRLSRKWVSGLLFLGELCIAIHLIAMGFKGWLTPHKWHGGLPPISILCFAVVAATLIVLLLPSSKKAVE